MPQTPPSASTSHPPPPFLHRDQTQPEVRRHPSVQIPPKLQQRGGSTPQGPPLQVTKQQQYSPPLVQEEGSTASTDNLCPLSVSIFPKYSIKVDFPAPGGPDNPMVETDFVI